MSRRQVFDMVVEPGELAAALDRGLTVAERSETLRVAPITLLGNDELLSREQARAHLGLDRDRPCVLLMLGSYRTGETDAISGHALDRLAEWEDAQIAVPKSMTPASRAALPPNAVGIDAHPLSRYFNAFDAALSGAGYNAFHELVGAGVPTVFVPQTTKTDDQVARARFAAGEGLGLDLHPFSEARLDECLAVVRDPVARDAMRTRLAELPSTDGAAEAAEAIAVLVEEGRALVPGPAQRVPDATVPRS
jgi:UDP:flavonoid glycosyltransferase YjiC (YdhE family)